jgi:hypothetical protein
MLYEKVVVHLIFPSVKVTQTKTYHKETKCFYLTQCFQCCPNLPAILEDCIVIESNQSRRRMWAINPKAHKLSQALHLNCILMWLCASFCIIKSDTPNFILLSTGLAWLSTRCELAVNRTLPWHHVLFPSVNFRAYPVSVNCVPSCKALLLVQKIF